MIKSGIKKCFGFLGLEISKTSTAELNDPIVSKKKYFRDILRIDLPHSLYGFCYRGFEFIKSLHDNVSATFYLDKQELRVKVGGLSYIVTSWEELLILKEVFVEGIYNFQSIDDFAFIDVGMNVGITSLYFSQVPSCKEILSFEPFDKTLIKAEQNLALNESSKKITVKKFGLGYPERTIEVNYSEEYKGSVGINGVASYINKDIDREVLELKIKDVYEALSSVIASDLKKVMKIDCEGAEYEIIRRLDETRMIKDINFYMIEWHINGPGDIKSIFKRNGFDVLSFNDLSKDIGLIYAYKGN
jgi:FkbM family methyltransferase